MSRYWQVPGSGFIYTEGAHGAAPSDAIEVRVVPLDAIVIERSELPAEALLVHDGQVKSGHVHAYLTESPDWYRNSALHHLALAEYLTEHPPVDEAQVEALAAVLIAAEMDHVDGPTPYVIARRLIATGKVTVEVTR